MTPGKDNHKALAEIQALANQWLEGVISAEGRNRFNELLFQSREGRDLFLELAQMDAGLHWMFASREKVAALLNAEREGETRPAAIIAQQRLGLGDDQCFVRGFQRCAQSEAHLQAWLQIYPRIRAAAILSRDNAADPEEVVGRIIDAFFNDYAPGGDVNAVWRLASRSTASVIGDGHAKSLGSDLAQTVCQVAFRGPQCAADLDTVAIYEVLDEYVPHSYSAETLRLLCLRYLHGLTPQKIALHLGRSAQEIRLQLAKPRLDLVQRCLGVSGGDNVRRYGNALGYLDLVIDGHAPSTAVEQELKQWIKDDQRHASVAILVAIVHDFLERQFSAVRLLDELSVRHDKSYLKAIEQSLKEIEVFAAPLTKHDEAPPVASAASTFSGKTAAMLSLAASVLIAVGVGVWSSGSPNAPTAKPPETAPLASNDAPPVAEVAQADPPLPPVVGVVSETLGLTSEDAERISIGTLLRRNDAIAFRQGLVQMSTTTGSTLVLQGPVDAAMDKANSISLHRGKLTGLNANRGEPLIIQTPTSRVVDLGTEFGVGVAENNETSVSVYEGEVEFEIVPPSAQDPVGASLRLEAGWEASLSDQGALPDKASPLTHDREFVRVDEVQLRKDAGAGVDAARKAIDFFELLRTNGLIAYQGFDALGNGDEVSVGFREPAIRQLHDADVATGTSQTPAARALSGSLKAISGVSYYLDLDTSARSYLAKAGLVDENGVIGRRPGDVWLAWRTQSVGAPAGDFSWAGLSLMFGDNRSENEPLFVGLPVNCPSYGMHIYPGGGAPLDQKILLDQDPVTDGDQAFAPDDRDHQWVLHLQMDGTNAIASVWCDVDPSRVAETPPQATSQVADLKFDRFRFEVMSGDKEGAWLLDDIVIALSPEAVAEAIDRLGSSR
ncbi:MAG: FecR domain-containing protein [Planctomycetales bacterium]|nr:FecR domain-containing protein [Planctomycetales bacterium]